METKGRIRQFILENFYVEDPSALKDESLLLEAGIIDSTGVLELVSFLEGTWGVHVEDAEMLAENFDSIERIAAFLARKGAGEGISQVV